MKPKRERLQVIHDILLAIQKKDSQIKPTHIMYKANLSHQMLDDYLKYLISEGFIEEIKAKSSRTFSLTEKGHEYIKQYNVIRTFIDSFGLG